MRRVRGRLDDGTQDREGWWRTWGAPNVAIRIEVPFQADEFHGVPDAPVTASRVYTVATADAARREITVDLVVHEGDSPAMRWLRSVRPGDVVELSSTAFL